MRGLDWYRARLSAMSPAEVGHRVESSVREQLRRFSAGRPQASGALLEEARRVAAAGARRPIRLFDVLIDYPREALDWSRDYRSGKRAPLRFYGDVDYRDEAAVGDSKYTWELSRHQFVVPWAAEWRETGDEGAAGAVVAVILDWIAANPRYLGINWISSLEHALRLLSWGLALELCADAPLVRQARPLVLASVSDQADFIRHTLSGHSSANNHLLGELVGLLAAGVFFPDAERTGLHARAVAPRFVEEMRRQNFADGVNREQAVYYHHYVLEYLLVGMRLFERLGLPVPEDLPPLARRMLSFVDAMTDDAGAPFAIGDADDGVVSGLNLGTGVGPFESLLWTAWVAYGDASCGGHAARIARARGEEPQVDRSTAYWHGPAPAPAAPIGETGRWVFPEGGYFVGREDDAAVLFRAGPFGYPAIAAHSHCDQLSVLVRLQGRMALTDSGTGVYHTDEGWRRYFRGTRAHNTVRVDGRDQAEYAGPFLWGTHADGRLRVERNEPDAFAVSGAHDGYRRLDDPVQHERRLAWRRGLGFRVEDKVAGRRSHTCELVWNFGPEVELTPLELLLPDAPFSCAFGLNCGGRSLGNVVITCDHAALMARHRGDPEVPAGFESPRYRVFRPIEQLVISAQGPSCRFTTLVLTGAADVEAAILERWD